MSIMNGTVTARADLSPAHHEYLAAHAVSDAVLGAAQVFSAGQVIVFPWRDTAADGSELVTFQKRQWPDPPSGPPPMKYVWEAGRPLHFAAWRPMGPAASEATRTAVIVEGTKQSLAVASYAPPEYAVYGMAGCWGWAHCDLSRFEGRRVIIMLDADAGENLDVYDAGDKLAAKLGLEGAASAEFVPSPAWGKGGIDDYLATVEPARRTQHLAKMLSATAPKPAERRPRVRRGAPDEPDTDGRPLITVNRDRRNVIRDIHAAMRDRWDGRELFSYGGVLTRLRGAVTEPLDKDSFMAWLAEGVATYKYTPAGAASPARWEPCWPDPQTAGAVLSRGDEFAPLNRVAATPFARPDGTICSAPGYDSPTGTVLVPGPDLAGLSVPEMPDRNLAAAAASFLLDEWLGDMPFRDDASRANALAMVLTPFTRGLYPLVPLAVVSGIQPGVGKSMLADCLHLMCLGEPAQPLPWIEDDDDEIRKQILSAFRAGQNFICFDEAHVIGGPALTRAITAVTYADRILGVSKMASFPNQMTWMSLGNQVSANADMARRVYYIEIYPPMPNPQDRDESDFAHPDLRTWTLANRRTLVAAALTVVRAWFAAGQPGASRGSLMGSFERWDKMMSGILAHAGVGGFLGNMAERRAERDTSGGLWADHLIWLRETFGAGAEFTVLDVLVKAQSSGGAWDSPPGRLDNPSEPGFARSLGNAYSRQQDRWFGNFRLHKAGIGHRKVVKWVIEELGGQSLNVSPGPVDNSADPPSKSGGTTEVQNPFGVFPAQAGPAGTAPPGPVLQTPLSPNGNSMQNGVFPGTVMVDYPQNLVPPVPPGHVFPVFPENQESAGSGVHGGVQIRPSHPPVSGSSGQGGSAENKTLPDLGGRDMEGQFSGGVMEGREVGGTPQRVARDVCNDKTRAHTYRNGSSSHPSRPSVPPGPPGGPEFGFDLETADADQLFLRPRGQRPEFVRLAGIIGPSGQPVIGSVPGLLEMFRHAGRIYGHSILSFDGLALAWHHQMDWESFAAKALDTEITARQADPPRSRESGTSADRYTLDAVAERLGVPGKTDELKRLARKHGGYDMIPQDDEEYRSYLHGDLRASRAVRERLPEDDYTRREHVLATIAGRMTLSGFRVDQPLLARRIAEGAERKGRALELLHAGWGLPLGRAVTKGRGEGKHEEWQEFSSPLATTEGRAWFEETVTGRYQVPDPPRTPKSGDLATGADALKPVLNDPRCPADLRAMLTLVAIVTTTRTVYQTASNHLAPDGRVHPRISFRQASGRWSVTDPGLTVFGKRGGKHIERGIFLPDDEDHVLLSCDLSQVDMRSMAGHSQDPGYMAMFEPGRDAHEEIAEQVYGTRKRRHDAKAVGHGWNYGLGPKAMIEDGMDPGMVHGFIAGMESRFPRLIAWREEIRAQGRAGVILDNGFGRRMRCEPSRAYTVAPALMGQGGARDIMCQSLLRLPRELWQYLRVMVHDEIVLSVPRRDADEIARTVQAAMTWTWRNVPILCDMSKPGANWGEISEK